MKSAISFFSIFCLLAINTSIIAQSTHENENDFLTRSPLYDYSNAQLKNTDTIPGFETKPNKLKISGIIYESDGVTPAKDVILYIDQADENGDFDLRYQDDKRYVYNRGWVKTDADGRYTFFTYVPGNDRRYNQMQQLFPIVKAPTQNEYELASFLFEDDPFLTKTCRKRMAKKGDITRILNPKSVDGLLVVNKDIVLKPAGEDMKI